MTFSFTNWVLGFALTKLASTSSEKIAYRSFSQKLDNVVIQWSNELPNDIYVDPYSIFPNSNDKNKDLSTLKQKFISKEIPDKTDWEIAIFSQWQIIKEEIGEGAQPFYLLNEVDVKPYVKKLASQLYNTCRLENDFFKVKVLNNLEYIIEQINEIRSDLNSNTISTKIESINEITKSIRVLSVFWPLNPMITKCKDDYYNLHQIAEKAKLEIHHSYDIVSRYSDKYEMSEIAKNRKTDLIKGLNSYLEFVDYFYLGKIIKEIDPKDMAELAWGLDEGINQWLNVLRVIKEALKYDLDKE